MKTNEAQQIDNISFSSLRMASLCIQFESIWKFASNIFVTLNIVRFFQFNFFFFFFSFILHLATSYLSLFFFLQWFIVYPIYWNIMGYFIQFVEISSNHSCVLNTHKQIASRNILPVRWFNTLPKFIYFQKTIKLKIFFSGFIQFIAIYVFVPTRYISSGSYHFTKLILIFERYLCALIAILKSNFTLSWFK